MTETPISSGDFVKPAKLLDLDTGRVYSLPTEVGAYSIGRNDNDSKADIQIETKDKYMSRLHIGIEVKKWNDRYTYHICLRKEANNPIIIDGRIVKTPNETIPLEKNQVIRLPFVKLRIIE